MGITSGDPQDTKIEGGTDATLIGNVGDRLKVISQEDDDDAFVVDPKPPGQIVWIDRRFANGSNENLDVNGAGTAQDFTFGPPSGQVWYVRYVSLLILDPGSPDVDDFGSIGGGLSNGLQFIQKINSVEYQLGNFRDNGALTLCFTDSPVFGTANGENGQGWLDEDDTFLGTKSLDPPVKLNGDNGDEMIVRVRDNLNAVQRLQLVGRAWYEI